jgi:hypothetical protein
MALVATPYHLTPKCLEEMDGSQRHEEECINVFLRMWDGKVSPRYMYSFSVSS